MRKLYEKSLCDTTESGSSQFFRPAGYQADAGENFGPKNQKAFNFSTKNCMKTSRAVKCKIFHPETGQILVSKSQQTQEKKYQMCPLHLLLQIGGPESLVDLEKQIIFEESGLVAPNGKTALMMVASGVISHNAYAKNTRSKMQSKIGHINLDAGNRNKYFMDLFYLRSSPPDQSRETRDYERGEDENNGQLADDFSHNGGAQPDRKRSKTCDQETGRKLSRDCRALEREVISHLLAIGSNPELQNPFTGETAAHYAVKHDRADLLRLFLTRGISTWTTDFSGNNLLHTSINWNSHRCFDLISTLFIGEIDAIDFYYGETALMRAVMMMMNKEAHDLVSRGVSLLVTDYRGRNCLHWASIVGNHEMLKTLIDNGVPVNVLDKSNYTPLIYACAEGHFECVKILVDESAKIFVCDSLNRLSWEIAEMRGNLKIAEYLRKVANEEDYGSPQSLTHSVSSSGGELQRASKLTNQNSPIYPESFTASIPNKSQAAATQIYRQQSRQSSAPVGNSRNFNARSLISSNSVIPIEEKEFDENQQSRPSETTNGAQVQSYFPDQVQLDQFQMELQDFPEHSHLNKYKWAQQQPIKPNYGSPICSENIAVANEIKNGQSSDCDMKLSGDFNLMYKDFVAPGDGSKYFSEQIMPPIESSEARHGGHGAGLLIEPLLSANQSPDSTQYYGTSREGAELDPMNYFYNHNNNSDFIISNEMYQLKNE